MPRTIVGQVLASTTEDTQGERYDRQFLEDLVAGMPQRQPLHQKHDLSLPCAGYISNPRVAPHPRVPGEWAILADVELSGGEGDPDLRGFSWSATVGLRANSPEPLFGHYLPFPAYKHDILDQLLDQDEPVLVGKWLKKEVSPQQVGLIVAFTTFVARPIWDQVYKEAIWPLLSKQLDRLRERWWKKGGSTDYMQVVKLPSGVSVQLLFIPERRNEDMAYSRDALDDGVRRASEVALNEMSESMVPKRVRAVFDGRKGQWEVIAVEFTDGQVLHLAP